MRTLLAIVTLVAWSLWFGGSVAMFIFVQTLFRNNRAVAIEAAPMMFRVFAMYQIVLAGVAVISVGIWRLASKRAVLTTTFWLLALASAGVVATGAYITPRMERMRLQGQSSSPEFRKLHGVSMVVYLGQTGVLLVTGMLLPFAVGAVPASPSTTDAESRATQASPLR
jgi:hypothetical protein